MHWCVTGHFANATGNFPPTHPSVGSVTARVRGPSERGMPAYVHLGFKSGNPVYDANHNAAYLGGGHNPFRVTNNPNDEGFADRGNFSQLDDRRVERVAFAGVFVDVHDADGAGVAAAEREVGDVHAVAAENRAHFADDARLIVVRDNQHRPAKRRLDVDAADRDEPGTVRLEDGPFDPALA